MGARRTGSDGTYTDEAGTKWATLGALHWKFGLSTDVLRSNLLCVPSQGGEIHNETGDPIMTVTLYLVAAVAERYPGLKFERRGTPPEAATEAR